MRALACFACAFEAVRCAERAMGAPQLIYPADMVGLWWLSALFWALTGLVISVRGAP